MGTEATIAHSAMDVANFFVDSLRGSEDPMTNARLNKFIYFAQGYCLQRLGRPLFSDEVEAWTYGPVVPEVYHAFKTDDKYAHIVETKGPYDVHEFSPEEINLMLDVIEKYDKLSTRSMIDESHQGPWKQYYNSTKAHVVIPKRELLRYFSSLSSLPDAFEDALRRAKRVGEIGPDGHTVLPDDWDE